MSVIKMILTALVQAFLQWFRDRSIRDTIRDAGVKAERLRVMEAERKANEKVDSVKPVRDDDLVSRLRDGGQF